MMFRFERNTQKNMKRNEIKDVHEGSVLESFKKQSVYLNKIIEVISKPEPPDAIITINGNTTWIEITDAFFSRELAQSVTTHVADDKTHKPVPKEKRFCIEPDEQFSSTLESVIVKKYDKESIGKVYKQYGSGILLVGVINPFFAAKNLVNIEKQRILEAVKSKEERFNEIYLYDVYDHIFHKLL
jgi:hypothetical protein